MIFICTCSQDGASNLLEPFLRSAEYFRFNIDRSEDYTWDFSREGFEIRDLRTQTVITKETLTSFYLRKPHHIVTIDVPKEGCLENWRRQELRELFEELYRLCAARNLTALIQCRESQCGKMQQMTIAEKYFKIARWHIFHGALPTELTQGRWVAKALTGTQIGKGKGYFVKEVDPTKLDLYYPWFLQEKVEGEDEVTVVFVDGKLFAYRFPRSKIEDCDDVRRSSIVNPSHWKRCELSPSEQKAIHGFMTETGYRFGRFDFIRKDGELWFLEMNPNGQWAWLDEKNEDGLISAIADAIISEDNEHPRNPEPAPQKRGRDSKLNLSARRIRFW